MLMRVMYVQMVIYFTDSSSKMRMPISHLSKLQDLISLVLFTRRYQYKGFWE